MFIWSEKNLNRKHFIQSDKVIRIKHSKNNVFLFDYCWCKLNLFLCVLQDQQVAVVENDISKETLEVSHTRARAERLKNILEELDEEIKQKNEIISKSEADIVKRNAMIERKQGIIDQYNKKLEQMIAQAGVSTMVYSL